MIQIVRGLNYEQVQGELSLTFGLINVSNRKRNRNFLVHTGDDSRTVTITIKFDAGTD